MYSKNIRTILASAVIAAAAFFVSVPAHASLTPIPIRLKAGLLFPSTAPLNGGDQWWKVGADVDMPLGIGLFGKTRIGIEWYQQCDKNSIIPITVTQIYSPSFAFKNPIYVGAGVGLWTAKIVGTPTSTRFGGRLVAGLDLTKSYFIEGEYDFVQKVSGIGLNNLSIAVGFKF
jgi:hypothetical protein